MCFQTCDLIAYCRVFYAAPEHCSNLCLNKSNGGSQVPIAFVIFVLSTHAFRRYNLKSFSSIFILHQWTPRSDLLRFIVKVSVPAGAECSAWHPKLKLCSFCLLRYCIGSHGFGTGPSSAILPEMQKVERNLLAGLREFWFCQKTKHVLHTALFSFALAYLWCFQSCSVLSQGLLREEQHLEQALMAALGNTIVSFF